MKRLLVLLGALTILGVVVAATLTYLLFAALIRYATLEPRTDRAWAEDQAYAARAVPDATGAITIDRVRDWTYASTGPQTRDWITATVAPDTVTGTWLYLDRFSEVPGVAHAFLVFDFADGQTLALSVEARREAEETYSPVAGLFRRYELTYLWATERDIVTRRVVYQNSAVFRHRLALPPALAESVLRNALARTNTIAGTPAFYNTLTDNCMGLLAELVNDAAPGALPWDLSWLVPGLADRYLLGRGLVGTSGESLSGLRAQAALAPYRTAIEENAASGATAFSAWLRTLPD